MLGLEEGEKVAPSLVGEVLGLFMGIVGKVLGTLVALFVGDCVVGNCRAPWMCGSTQSSIY